MLRIDNAFEDPVQATNSEINSGTDRIQACTNTGCSHSSAVLSNQLASSEVEVEYLSTRACTMN